MKENLSDKLTELIEESTRESTDAEIEKVRRMIAKEKSKLRQMKIITVSLWILSLLLLAMSPQLRGMVEDSYGRNLSVPKLLLYIASHWLPFIAFVSTVILLFRLWSNPKKEANLRLMIIEQKLSKLEEAALKKER